MAKILYEDIGPNYQVPGLPYEETYQFVHPVVVEGIPTPDDIQHILQSSDENTLTNPWSIDVIKGFRDYIPTTFRRITQKMPNKFMQEYFGLDQNWIPESERVLLQLQTEIEAKGATLDSAIIHGRRELGTVVNKAHVLNRLYMIGQIYDHLKERPYPFLFGDLRNEQHWDEALSQMKYQFMEYLLEIPSGKRKFEIRKRTVEVSEHELQHRFPYVQWLREKLGDNLVGILLYGSASRTDDPAQFSDYDNWVRVKDLRKAHNVLRLTKPSVLEEKVVEGAEHSSLAKHVGIHLFPSSDEYLQRHIRFLHDSREFLEHTLVLHGEFDFPIIDREEVIERGISHAYVKLKTVAGSLNWAYTSPEKIIGKPNLYEFIVKNIRFFLQHSLNSTHEYKFRNKAELNGILANRGIYLPEYKPDLQHIRTSLLFSLSTVLQLQQELLAAGKKPNMTFLRKKKLAELPQRWEQLDD
ncbi:MAG: hypothetical protein V1725_06495 [archaeon]